MCARGRVSFLWARRLGGKFNYSLGCRAVGVYLRAKEGMCLPLEAESN